MRFVIIGGDAAGMSAASRARRLAREMEILVLEKTNDVSYSAAGMPYNLADPSRLMDDLVVRTAEEFREKQNIDLRLGHTAAAIDVKGKRVTGTIAGGDSFEVHYDKLLIATGARPTIPNIPGVDCDGVMGLKSLEDGRRIKGYLAARAVKSALIIGMGYIGLEMAEALHARGVKVEMIKERPRLLPWMPEAMAEVVRNELRAKGVSLRFGANVTMIEKAGSGLKVTMANGADIVSDMVIFGIGVTPNSEIAADAGLELGPKRAIAVDRTLRTSAPDIFAAGDCADAFQVITGKRVWAPLGLRANRAGWAVADNVTGGLMELPGIAGTAVFSVFDLEVARTGLSVVEAHEAGFDPVETVIQSRSRTHAHPGAVTIHVGLVGDKKTAKLLGATMVGKEGVAHRIQAAAVALHAGMTVADFAQCDLSSAPPFSPVWDPLLIAAIQLSRAIK